MTATWIAFILYAAAAIALAAGLAGRHRAGLYHLGPHGSGGGVWPGTLDKINSIPYLHTETVTLKLIEYLDDAPSSNKKSTGCTLLAMVGKQKYMDGTNYSSYTTRPPM